MNRHCLYIFLTTLLAGSLSWAEEGSAPAMPHRARLLLPGGCDELPFDQVDLVSTLRIELLGHGTELRHTGENEEFGEVVVITVDAPSCTGTDVLLSVTDPGSGAHQDRRVDVTDRQHSERGRILALAIAELLVEAWPALLGTAPPQIVEEPEPEPPSQAEEAPVEVSEPIDEEALRNSAVAEAVRVIQSREESEREAVQRIRVTATLVTRIFPMVQSGQLGGQVGLAIQLSRRLPLHLALDVGYGYGGGSSELGDIELQTAIGGLALLIMNRSSRVRAALGPRLELGWGWAEGHPIDEDVTAGQVDGFLLSLSLAGGARIRVSERLWLMLDGQLGWYAADLEPRAGGRALGGASRLLIGLGVGLAVGL